MNAPYTDLFEEGSTLDPAVTTPFASSRKTYVAGRRDDVKVAMREVDLAASAEEFGGGANPPVPIYDTSGPYTDPDVAIDIRQGLAPLRQAWIDARDDTETLPGPSSAFGRNRGSDPELAPVRFPQQRPSRRARSGTNVSQMHYARQGIVTPEMNTSQSAKTLGTKAMTPAASSIPVNRSGPVFHARSPRNSCARKWLPVVRSSRRTSIIRKASQ